VGFGESAAYRGITEELNINRTQVELDWLFALEHDCNTCLNPVQKTVKPANINDEDLNGIGPIVPKPMNVRTVRHTPLRHGLSH
jgi:hypothetical protein